MSRDRISRAARNVARRLQSVDVGGALDGTVARLRASLPGSGASSRRHDAPYRADEDYGDYAQPQVNGAHRPVPPQPDEMPWWSPGRLTTLFSGLRSAKPARKARPAAKPQLAQRQPAARAQARPRPQPTQNEPRTQWLAAHGLVKTFGGRAVVNGVTLGLRRGEVVGLLGPNGAGKTTTFYMITGLIAADAGAIELDGFDVTHLPMYRRARLGVGYLPQEPSIFRGMTVEQNIMAVLELVEPDKRAREHQLDSLLEEFSITRVRKSPAIALSGGERRRVEIARALASRPVFMLLDEPFAGIDPIAVNDIRTLVRHLTGRGIGVLITDHNVRETLSLIDRAYIIHDGKVLMEGTPQAVVANDAVRQNYLGQDFSL
ncbi:LPS export ABC transporter ATP-binding protein [Tepidamorphus sp. 3E244]|uniref:LPS export ABC transporter ATP-binding protein n=1 Tax=Tepidamorphus sp. 3E244 TaxID=3385498 RepID=UPI0038FD206A